MGAFALLVGSASIRGKERPTNQDALFYAAEGSGAYHPDQLHKHGHLLAVADGGGGSLAAPVVQALAGAYYRQAERNVADNLRLAFHECNLRAQAQRLEGQDNTGDSTEPGGNEDQAVQATDSAASHKRQLAGATLVALVAKDGLLYVANVGDSRAYLLRDHRLWPLTRDHTDQTRPEGKAARLIGVSPYLETDLFLPLALDVGDRLLLCTDGLSDSLPESARLASLTGARSPQEAAAALVEAAATAGPEDDVSVIVAELRRPPLPGGFSRTQAIVLAVVAGIALLLLLWFLVELWLTIY